MRFGSYDKKSGLDLIFVQNIQNDRRLGRRAVVKSQVADLFGDGLFAHRVFAVQVGVKRLVFRRGGRGVILRSVVRSRRVGGGICRVGRAVGRVVGSARHIGCGRCAQTLDFGARGRKLAAQAKLTRGKHNAADGGQQNGERQRAQEYFAASGKVGIKVFHNRGTAPFLFHRRGMPDRAERISDAMISPATEGTKGRLPGDCRRPGGSVSPSGRGERGSSAE